MKVCLNCKENFEGRSDKKFCSPYCKSSYHYQSAINTPKSLFLKIDKQLKTNRRILKLFNKSGKSIVRKEKLIKEGFDPKYFTHYWKNPKNEIYLFCYEYGFLYKKEKMVDKYVLVEWQAYMDK